MISALVSWPTAPLTDSLVHKALQKLSRDVTLVEKTKTTDAERLLQWSTYDDIDHELTHFKRETVLASSYTFRKALIRKHYLSRGFQSYLKKNPNSILTRACPRTFEIEISFADELDEMWTDELWELGEAMQSESSWWILKPGMADRGMGIRLFNSKDELQEIFESFDGNDSDAEEDDEDGTGTTVVTSQLRHFVVQEYISNPLLLDPTDKKDGSGSNESTGRKFHLRAYCVASGDIKLYLYTRILALFSSESYTSPSESALREESGQIDLRPHLTNSSLQTELGESNVRLLDELEGCQILSGRTEGQKLSRDDIDGLVSQMSEILAETFKSALQNPVHFQPLPNAFELFGVDFLVSHSPENTKSAFTIKILEVNSEPAIEMTGPRLTWILEDLFDSIAKVCVEPFFGEGGEADPWNIGEVRHNLVKSMEESVRPPGA